MFKNHLSNEDDPKGLLIIIIIVTILAIGAFVLSKQLPTKPDKPINITTLTTESTENPLPPY